MRNLEVLQKQFEQQLNVSPTEASERLTRAAGYAINTPLGAIKMGAELLKDHAESIALQQWADQCYQQSLAWRDAFRQILNDCLSQPDTSCYCLLQRIETLFVQSPELQAAGKQQPPETKLADVQALLLRELAALSQIQLQLQTQDLSWLLPHVAVKDIRD